MEVELRPLLLESSLTMQKILEADGHQDRVALVKYFMNAETRRLASKKTLKGIFSSDPSAVTTTVEEEKEEPFVPPSMPSEDSNTSGKSTFFDEPDAFQ